MKYLSLFSWIGGFELWIQQAYEKSNVSTSSLNKQVMIHMEEWSTNTQQECLGTQQPTCIGFSEIDKYASLVYKSHFPNHHEYGDITKIDENNLPDFDLLVGWFPCQAFSIAWKRKWFEDTRGTLFFEIARILRAKQPRLLWLENVKGLLSHDNGKTFSTIIATLDELGYDIQWQVLNSKNHWVPQNRERVFIIWHLRGTPRPEVFPFGWQSNENSTIGITTETAVARTLTAGWHSGWNHSGMTIIQINQPKHSNDRVYSEEWLSPTINTMQGGNRQPFVEVKPRIRRLTPGECLALQWFPRNWCDIVSDSQKYKCSWNAVTVNVIEDIAKRLLKEKFKINLQMK